MEELVPPQPAIETATLTDLPTRNTPHGPLHNKEDTSLITKDHQSFRAATSGLSLDDLEAAQALEGLRAGTSPFPTALAIVPNDPSYYQIVLIKQGLNIITILLTPRSTPPSNTISPPSKPMSPSQSPSLC